MESIANIIEQLQGKSYLPNAWGGHCFGCSPLNQSGLHMRVWLLEDHCISRLRIPAEYCGFDGIAHGGIIAGVLDEIGAWAIVVILGRLGMTKEATIQYLRPVPVSTEILASGVIHRLENDRVETSAAIYALDGSVLARATSKWVLPSATTLAKASGIEEHVIKRLLDDFLVPIKEYKSNHGSSPAIS